MSMMLRSCGRLVKGLDYWVAPRCAPGVAIPKGVFSLHSTHMPFSSVSVWPLPSWKPKDFALPNSSWSKDMMDQFNKFMEMSKDRTWRRIPSHRHIEANVPEHMMQQVEEEKRRRDSCYFCRSISTDGLGFEYVMFFNPSQKRMVCIFQPGPYLEGPPGFVHGGSIATILDSTFALCAMFAASAVLTANLSINYKSPLRLGTVVLVDSKVDRTEGKKTFISGQVQSTDGQTLYVDGTALVFQVDSSMPVYHQLCSK